MDPQQVDLALIGGFSSLCKGMESLKMRKRQACHWCFNPQSVNQPFSAVTNPSRNPEQSPSTKIVYFRPWWTMNMMNNFVLLVAIINHHQPSFSIINHRLTPSSTTLFEFDQRKLPAIRLDDLPVQNGHLFHCQVHPRGFKPLVTNKYEPSLIRTNGFRKWLSIIHQHMSTIGF